MGVPTGVRIEKIGPEALEPAFALLRRFFLEEGFDTPAEELRASLRVMLTAESSAVFLAWSGDKPVGVATANSTVGLEYGRSAELEDLYVLPDARGRGVAGGLIEAACDWCERRGCSTLLVTVTPAGDAAHDLAGFYERRGFANTGRIIMARTLNRR
jgi:aminoglycoside 6'-N-acetyltransferase I